MSIFSSLILALVLPATAPATAPSAVSAAPLPRFFAALQMTKAQVNSSTPATSGLFLRLPAGQWRHFGGDQIKWVNTAAVNPVDPNVVYLGCGNGILRSRDDGRSWRLTTDWHVADVLALQVDPADPATIYAATGWGIWLSTDAGDSWRESDRGVPLTGKFTQALVLDRTEPGRLVAGTFLGFSISTDRAENWTPLAGGPEIPILHLEQSGADPRLWIAGTQGDGLLISTDGARTWSAATPALAGANVYGAATDPTDAARIAAAGWAQGVRVSADGGKTWRDSTRGLPGPHVTALAFDPTHARRLWASTFEEGTYYSDDLGATWRVGGLYGAYVNELRFLPAKL